MRVLHVDPERGWGGGETQVLGLARALVTRGHAVTLAADPAGRLAAAATGLAIVPLPIAHHADVRAGLRLRRLAGDVDVVHFHTARAHAMAPLCRGRGARLVVTRRMDYVPRGGPYARYLYNRGVDAVIAISEGVRAALLRAGVRPERITVVPSGVDPLAKRARPGARETLRAAWGVRPEELVVLVVGALERRKGHAVLLDAATMLAPELPHLRYVFCGTGAEAARLAATAAPLGARVQFLGFRDDVPDCLAAADVVAVPSLQEGLGVAALEAMAAGRPVAASATGGLAEAVVDAETGYLVPPGAARPLADALRRLGTDPALRVRLGAGGAERVRTRFTMAAMAEGTLACYERTASCA